MNIHRILQFGLKLLISGSTCKAHVPQKLIYCINLCLCSIHIRTTAEIFLAGKAPTVPTTSLVWRNQNLFETCSLHLCGLFYTWILKPEPRMALIFMDSQTRNFAIFQDFKSLFQSELLFSNFWTEVFQFLKNNKIFC